MSSLIARRSSLRRGASTRISRLIDLTARAASSPPLLGDLAALILAPVVPLMGSDMERVIIAADGALGYIPFSVLPLQRAGESTPLLEVLEVSNVPSMSAVAAQRRRTEQAPPKTLAVFADPVFAAKSMRLVSAGITTAQSGETSRVIGASRTAACTWRREAAIAELVALDSRLRAGFDASRAEALNAPLVDYRFVHFATHGLVDLRYPELSALAFSLFDAAGRPQNGFLRLLDSSTTCASTPTSWS